MKAINSSNNFPVWLFFVAIISAALIFFVGHIADSYSSNKIFLVENGFVEVAQIIVLFSTACVSLYGFITAKDNLTAKIIYSFLAFTACIVVTRETPSCDSIYFVDSSYCFFRYVKYLIYFFVTLVFFIYNLLLLWRTPALFRHFLMLAMAWPNIVFIVCVAIGQLAENFHGLFWEEFFELAAYLLFLNVAIYYLASKRTHK